MCTANSFPPTTCPCIFASSPSAHATTTLTSCAKPILDHRSARCSTQQPHNGSKSWLVPTAGPRSNTRISSAGDRFAGRYLVRTANGVRAASLPIPDRLYPLHLASRLTQEASGDANHFLFRDPRGRAITTKDSAVRGALARLADAYPSSVKTEELIKSDPEPALGRNSDSRDRVCKALFALVTAHQATASTLPTRAGRADANTPKVWPLARLEAAARQPWLTSLGHAPISARNIDRDLIAHLDGNLDRPAFVRMLCNCCGREGSADRTPHQIKPIIQPPSELRPSGISNVLLDSLH